MANFSESEVKWEFWKAVFIAVISAGPKLLSTADTNRAKRVADDALEHLIALDPGLGK